MVFRLWRQPMKTVPKAAARLEHCCQAANYRVIQAVSFVVAQGLSQRAPVVPDVAPKQSDQFIGNSQVAIISRQRPGPDLTIADF
jgi:hypothetical protein